jgi:hypothetical protein
MNALVRSIKVSAIHFVNLLLLVALYFAAAQIERLAGRWCVVCLPLLFIPLIVFMGCVDSMEEVGRKIGGQNTWIAGAAASMIGAIPSLVPFDFACREFPTLGEPFNWFVLSFGGSLLTFTLAALWTIGQAAIVAHRSRAK